ncbi:MAG: porin [Ottowia sp.]|uniref:porin n=1 Tax=Ottowia sp. TaxID=1898956 RepID=UPI0039E68BAD
MKKSLIALAVLGLSGAAMAQSSVTLYGVADAGIGKIESGNDKIEFLSGSLMNNGGSRLGVRGVEDLGGGLKVGFNFETGLDLGDGATQGTSSGTFWGRAANVWVGGGWGTVKLGRTLNPSFFGTAAWELTGTANYSVVGNTYSFGGSGSRNSSQISYKTPDMGGFSAELGYILKPDNGGNAKWDVNAIYANGPIAIGLNAAKVNGAKTTYGLGGKYSFGNFALAASYSKANVSAGVRRGFSLGGQANFGAFALTLDVTRDTKNDAGKKFTNGVVELKYALSKRTFVYGAFLRLDDTNNYGLGIRHNF